MKTKIIIPLFIIFWLMVQSAGADDDRTNLENRNLPSDPDMQIIASMEYLELMDLVEDMELIKDLDFVIEDDKNEKNE